MATTAIRILKSGLAIRTKFITTQQDTHIDIDVFHCDEMFIPIGKPSLGVDERSEEEYHRTLRTEAYSRGQFVPEESTNPEWNPE